MNFFTRAAMGNSRIAQLLPSRTCVYTKQTIIYLKRMLANRMFSRMCQFLFCVFRQLKYKFCDSQSFHIDIECSIHCLSEESIAFFSWFGIGSWFGICSWFLQGNSDHFKCRERIGIVVVSSLGQQACYSHMWCSRLATTPMKKMLLSGRPIQKKFGNLWQISVRCGCWIQRCEWIRCSN